MESITAMGMDLAKNVIEICGRSRSGEVVLRRKLGRKQVLVWMSKLAPCVVGMEACMGAHYWARELEKRGHEVRLMAAQFVRPYVKSHKNDQNDAEAISEAMMRPTMRFVRAKSVEQQDHLLVHRIRERHVKARTSLVNEIRGFLMEYGVVVPERISSIRKELPRLLEDEDRLTITCRRMLRGLWEELKQIDERIEGTDGEIQAQFKGNDLCRRLATIPGVGPITATAVSATIADPRMFTNGRGLSAFWGLVPRQHSTGGKPKLLGISKRGDVYIRKLLIHGARAVIQQAWRKQDASSLWIRKLKERRGSNRAAVALANKNARRIWALMVSGECYRVA